MIQVPPKVISAWPWPCDCSETHNFRRMGAGKDKYILGLGFIRNHRKLHHNLESQIIYTGGGLSSPQMKIEM